MGDLSELEMDIEIADDNVPPAVNTNENMPPVPPPLPPARQPASRTSLPVPPVIVALRNLKKKPGDANVIKGCINILQNTLKHPDALPSTVWAILNDKEIEDNITSSIQLDDNVESISNLINTLQQRITPPGPSSSIPTANITPSVSRSSSSSSLRSHPYGNRPGKAEAKRIAKAKEEENDQYQFEICSLITTMSSSDVDIDKAQFPENLQYKDCIKKLVECQELRDQLESLGIDPPFIYDSTPRNLNANFAYNYHSKLVKLIGKHSNAKKFSGVKRFGNS